MRLLVSLLAVAACTLTVAACGDTDSAGSDGSSAGASGSSNDQDAARVRLQECLREQGVDLPEGGPGGGGGSGGDGEPSDIDRDEVEEAMEACAEFRDEAFGDVTEEDRQEFQDAFAKFSQCMRDEGIDVPDIEPGGGGPPGGGNQLDMDDPDVQAAIERCQDELPQGGPGPGPGGP